MDEERDSLLIEITEEILDTPFIKELNRLVYQEISETDFSKLLRTIVWNDLEFSLSLLSFLQVLIKKSMEILKEIVSEIDSMPHETQMEIFEKYTGYKSPKEMINRISIQLVEKIPMGKIFISLLKSKLENIYKKRK